jgi:hypothetical protein
VTVTTSDGLTPAEHRALRELFATTRQLSNHWATLAARLEPGTGDELAKGAASARRLLDELAERAAAFGLHGFPAAQSVGGSLSAVRNRLTDVALERNQALRTAVLDAQHVGTLLLYLAELARSRGDADLADWEESWQRRLQRHERAVRRVAVATGSDPDAAIEPLLDNPAGRAAHGVQNAVGTVGEWVDTSAVGRGVRKAVRSSRRRTPRGA